MLAFIIKGLRSSESEMSLSEKTDGREFGEAGSRKEGQEVRKALEDFIRAQLRLFPSTLDLEKTPIF